MDSSIPQVLLITGIGGLGDCSYNDAGFAGARLAINQLGIKLDLVELNEVSELSEATYLSGAAKKKYAIIVGLGYYQGEAANPAAKKFPQQKFILIDAISSEPNVKGVLFREEENAFLAGILSADVIRQSNLKGINSQKTIGIILGVGDQHVARYAFAYEAGAKTIDRDIKVLVDTVGNFQDIEQAKKLSLLQIDQGATIIYQVAGRAGLGVFEAVQKRGIYAIGEGLNQNALHPEFIIASTYKHMDLAIFDAIRDTLNNQFVGGNFFYGFKEKYLEISFEGSAVPITSATKKVVSQYQQKLAQSKIKAPTNSTELAAYLRTLG